MPEGRYSRFAFVADIVESVIVLLTVGLMCWVCNVVIGQGRELASLQTMSMAQQERLNRLELKGSSSLAAHVDEDNERITNIKARLDKVEAAVIALQTAPVKLEAISVRLDALKEGQTRIERTLEDRTRMP